MMKKHTAVTAARKKRDIKSAIYSAPPILPFDDDSQGDVAERRS
jgi:hypothetical protein